MWGIAAPVLESRGVSVPAAVLPPLPTEPELVEQWTRAMFTDHVGSQPQVCADRLLLVPHVALLLSACAY
jgi:hypothetical protein